MMAGIKSLSEFDRPSKMIKEKPRWRDLGFFMHSVATDQNNKHHIVNQHDGGHKVIIRIRPTF